MTLQSVLGIDLSKSKIDVSLHQTNEVFIFDNNKKGFKSLWKWLIQQQVDIKQLLFVMEHTGRYGLKLCQFLQERKCCFYLVPGLAIARSLGIQRGKTDKIDAIRIAAFGYLFQDRLNRSHLPENELLRLKNLHQRRQHLIAKKVGEQNVLTEFKSTDIGDAKEIIASAKCIIKCLTKEIKKLEKLSRQIIAEHAGLAKNYQLLTSVTGIGPVTAIAMLSCTDNFTKFTSSRKFACYCGVAPFKHESGNSLKGKTRVSHLANKQIKKLLYLCAMSAIQHDKQLKQYYDRKIQEGKHAWSVLNVIKNKLVQRMFAVVKRQTEYVDTFKFAA